MSNLTQKIKTIYISGMLCDCCKQLIELLLEKQSIPYISVGIGLINFPTEVDNSTIDFFLKQNKLKQIKDSNRITISRIKLAVIDLVHYANNNSSIIRNSDYLVDMLEMPYQTLSSLFADYENCTLEKYIIKHKIERTKKLILEKEMNLSEIAFQMGYSSVQYLSNQFKKTTGLTVSEFKKLQNPIIKALNEI